MMKFSSVFLTHKWRATLAVAGCLFSMAGAGQLEFGASGWSQYGMIMKSTDTIGGQDLDHRAMLGAGAQISLRNLVSEAFEVTAGLGVEAGHNISRKANNNGGYAPMNLGPYISEAAFRYNILGGKDDVSRIMLRGGLFPYDYVSDNRNLGLYLLRGPVYPGLLYSGFETKHVMPVANMLGFQLRHQAGGFHHDLILSSEIDLPPYFDISPAYLVGYEKESFFRVGAGVNFYHLIPIDDSLTNDPQWYFLDTLRNAAGAPVLDSNYNYLGDTTRLSFQGIKLMAHGSFDPKGLFPDAGIFGPEDLKIYAEIAVIGLNNGKAHKAIYGDLSKRMPVMFGINIPVFRLLDHLALEIESYKAPFRDNLDRFMTTAGNQPSPKPLGVDQVVSDVWEDKDNLKWSLHGERLFAGHVKFSFQIASDHLRPGLFSGYGDNNPPSRQAIMLQPSDWYWMTKLAYFF